MIDAEAMLNQLGEHAHRILLVRKEPGLDTFYHLVVPDGPDLLVGCPWRNDSERAGYIAALRKLAHEKGATAFGCIAEVWMTSYTHRELPDPLIRPSQSERRVEGVMAVYHDGIRTSLRRWLIERDKSGAISALRLDEDFGADISQIDGPVLDDILPSGNAK